MQELIKNFCEEKDTGIFLIDMPTGFGKTYNVLEFITNYYDRVEGKILFLTTLKKNLPFDELREHFVKKGIGDRFDELCIKIEANANGVILNLMYVYKDIPQRFKDSKEYHDLFNAVKLVHEWTNKKKDETISAIVKTTEKAIIEQYERAFRVLIEKDLKKFSKPVERLLQIKTNREYQWVGKLYPAVFTKDKKILFMSMDKFLLGNSTLIEPTYSFYNNPIIDKAVVFIDEFDATKDTILKRIIDKGLENRVDYLNLFKQVNSALSTREFPHQLLIDSKKQDEYKQNNPRKKMNSSAAIVSGFQEIFSDTYKKFNIQYSYKTSGSVEDKKRNFIFNDLQFHSVFSGGNSYIGIESDDVAKQNWIKFLKTKPENVDGGIIYLLSSVKGCISYFQKGCSRLAYNYKNVVDEGKRLGDDDFTLEQAINSLLSEFHLSREYVRYLTSHILSGQRSRKQKAKNDKLSIDFFDMSIYNRGFRYFDFIDEPEHNLQSKIMVYDFPDTPEKFLVNISERAKVIGISATASLDTVIGNYDVSYLKKALGDGYYEMSFKDKQRLNKKFQDFIQGYENVDIYVEPVGYCQSIETELMEIFSSKDFAKKYKEKLERQYQGYEYAMENFIKVLKAFKAFICNDDLQSFLCLTNKLAKEGKSLFDLKLLKEIGDHIIRICNKPYKIDSVMVQIDSDDFDTKKQNLISRLKNNEKVFVLSAYQTLGAGQNIQYPMPVNKKFVTINEFARGRGEKDFDGIYLEKPTNLLVNIREGLEEEELVKYIYQIEFLMERGELSLVEGISLIKDAFRSFSGVKNNFTGFKANVYGSKSVENYALRVLIQAVGRLCRTGIKNKEICLYVDESIFRMNFQIEDDRLLNPEFAKIVEKRRSYCEIKDETYETKNTYENNANTLSIKTVHIIKNLMRKWDENSIEIWKELRSVCLKHPTMSEDGLRRMPWAQNLYIKAPTKINGYTYTQEDDYEKNITIKFDGSLKQVVSENDVRLNLLMRIPRIREHFIQMDYATEFIANEYFLTPPLYNNIYKGALGEVIGKFLLKEYWHLDLKEIDNEEIFEFFDFRLGDDIYIDFKLWKETNSFDAEEQKNKIIKKLEACGGKRAIIINIMADASNYKITTSGDGKIVEIPLLCDIRTGKLDPTIYEQIRHGGYFTC
ncbi:hypothetical protein [Paenibacillus aestuarii]|uniref:Helicase ATP-binding domain-containing protein n=1 Tax=Paenibacillus aestuarii TaxID=516965 RepID=A0ABW0KFW2_9BACL|nr:hypothetical protein [Paenibacillus aestuarii]